MHNRIGELISADGSRNRSGKAPSESSQFVEVARRQLDRSRQTVEDFVAAHPAVCLGAAVSIGVVFGWWVKRK